MVDIQRKRVAEKAPLLFQTAETKIKLKLRIIGGSTVSQAFIIENWSVCGLIREPDGQSDEK